MSWKAECLLVNENGLGFYANYPQHSTERAIDLLKIIYPNSSIKSKGLSYLVDEFTPSKDTIAFGAYEYGCILSDWYNLIGCTETLKNPILDRIITIYPKASILAVELSGTTNLFGFALYEKSNLIRAFSGDSIHGVKLNIGKPLPEEDLCIQNGEQIVFKIMSRFLGVPLDQYASENLVVERFRRPR